MHRTALLALLAALAVPLIIAACVEHPTAPVSEPITVGPSFSFTGGSGKILGSTREGELVEIDFGAGTATLIGDAGTVGGDELGWTDIATDDTGRLFALSVFQTESEGVPYLYELNPANGSVIATLGATGSEFSDLRFSDFDHDGDTFYGSGGEAVFQGSGQLFSMDSTAQPTWISSDTLGYGLNPYDTIGPDYGIERGGFAIHPMTGDFWGIEALQSQAPVVFRIDPTTGLADSILRLGIDGVQAPQQVGFDGLHILDDGTFIATRGGAFTSEDSVVWEISSVPDAVSGLAEIAHIPLTFDTLIVGKLNGLTRLTSSPDSTFALSLTALTTELRPWVDSANFHRNDSLFTQLERIGDTTTVTVLATMGAQPISGVSVTITGKLIPGGGGHSHYEDSLLLGSMPDFYYSASPPQHVAGYLKDGTTRSDTISVATDSLGTARFAFVAGFLGGRVNIFADAMVGGAVVADTVTVTIKVPGLVNVTTLGSLEDSVYFIGPKEPHQSDSIWYGEATFADTLRAFVANLADPSQMQFVGVNDMSLPWGGSFTLDALLYEVSANNEVDRPNISHHFHAIGVDADIAPCFYSSSGKQTGFQNPSCSSASPTVDDVEDLARQLGLFVIGEGDHFHIRLGSEVIAWEPENE